MQQRHALLPILSAHRGARVHQIAGAVWANRGTGWYHLFDTFSNQGSGLFRVEDTSQDPYRFWITVGAKPDLSQAPTDTAASLPHTVAIPGLGSGDEVVYITTQQVNRFGRQSQEDRWHRFLVDSDAQGEEKPWPPLYAGDLRTVACAEADGYVRARAEYHYAEDGDLQADTWRVYVSDDGNNPYMKAPTVITMDKVDGVAKLDKADIGPFADDLLIKVGVRVRRSAGNTDSTNSDVHEVTANHDGPGAAAVAVFMPDEVKLSGD